MQTPIYPFRESNQEERELMLGVLALNAYSRGEDLTVAEAAELLGVSAGTIRRVAETADEVMVQTDQVMRPSRSYGEAVMVPTRSSVLRPTVHLLRRVARSYLAETAQLVEDPR